MRQRRRRRRRFFIILCAAVRSRMHESVPLRVKRMIETSQIKCKVKCYSFLYGGGEQKNKNHNKKNSLTSHTVSAVEIKMASRSGEKKRNLSPFQQPREKILILKHTHFLFLLFCLFFIIVFILRFRELLTHCIVVL